jgi:hypothetical protein
VIPLLGNGIFVDQKDAVVGAIAAKVYNTNVALQSLKTGGLSKYLSAGFNPDPTRVPALVDGPAITVVEDDGTTPFAPGLPVIATVVLDSPNPGDLEITGTDLADSEQDLVLVRILGAGAKTLYQKTIRTTNTGGTQGVVSDTSIVIPASLIPGVQATLTSVWVKFDSYASNTVAVT